MLYSIQVTNVLIQTLPRRAIFKIIRAQGVGYQLLLLFIMFWYGTRNCVRYETNKRSQSTEGLILMPLAFCCMLRGYILKTRTDCNPRNVDYAFIT